MKKIWILLSAVLLFSCAEEQPQEEETPSFIVMFMEGNDVLSVLEVKKGELVEELMIDPVWMEDSIYKIYDGWERQDGTVFDFETPINSNIILYPRTYTEDFTRIVTFVTENKELPSEKEEYTRTLQRGQCLQDLSDIEIDLFQHEGNTYIFYDDGWYTEDNQLFDFSTPIENNIVLTKKYLKITTPFFGAEIKLGVDHILYGILYSKLPEPQYEGHEIAFAFIDMYTKEIMYIATPFYQYENDGHNCVYTCSLDYLPESLYAVGICEIINNKKIFYGSRISIYGSVDRTPIIYYADIKETSLDFAEELIENINPIFVYKDENIRQVGFEKAYINRAQGNHQFILASVYGSNYQQDFHYILLDYDNETVYSIKPELCNKMDDHFVLEGRFSGPGLNSTHNFALCFLADNNFALSTYNDNSYFIDNSKILSFEYWAYNDNILKIDNPIDHF